MTAPKTPQLSHVALTVRDLDAAVDWYGKVFGVRHVLDVPHEGGVGRICATEGMGLVFALHAHDANEGESFHETRTGLDHVGLGVASRAELELWQDHLETHGVVRADAADRPLTQSAIVDAPYGSVLVFRDADNIQLELFCLPA